MDASTRAAVIAEALTWQGTPHRHHQKAKGMGADCAMFPLAVFQTVGVIGDVHIPYYSEQWHLHHSKELYLEAITELGARETDQLEPANFVIWKIGRTYSHGGIIVRWPTIIHALARQSVQLADATNDGVVSHRPFKVFELPSGQAQ